jgi:hypothetical protein
LSEYEPIQTEILRGERPYIDERFRNRSYIERKLVEIMERMWEEKGEDRPSIFEVVAFLTEVKTVHMKVSQQEKARTKKKAVKH